MTARVSAASGRVESCGFQRWWRNWTMECPEWRDEHYRADRRAPVMRKLDFETGRNRPDEQVAWQPPPWRDTYMRMGSTQSETVRGRGMRELTRVRAERERYATCSGMTGTQYEKPVTSIYGPLLRQPVYGLNSERNRHGFLPATDYHA